MRSILILMTIGGLSGIAVLDAFRHDWKTAILGVLFATANAIIFYWK